MWASSQVTANSTIFKQFVQVTSIQISKARKIQAFYKGNPSLCGDFMDGIWCSFSKINENINHRKISNISRTLVGNKIVDHSDVVKASPVGAAPTTSSFSTWHLASWDSAKTAGRQYENLISVGIWCILYWRLSGSFHWFFNIKCCRS